MWVNRDRSTEALFGSDVKPSGAVFLAYPVSTLVIYSTVPNLAAMVRDHHAPAELPTVSGGLAG